MGWGCSGRGGGNWGWMEVSMWWEWLYLDYRDSFLSAIFVSSRWCVCFLLPTECAFGGGSRDAGK
jgi:hypothetical protein